MSKGSNPIMTIRRPMRASARFWLPPLVIAGLMIAAILRYRIGLTIDETQVGLPLLISAISAISLLFPLVTWMGRFTESLEIYSGRVQLRQGLIRRKRRELEISNIRNIDIHQRLSQKLLRLGDFAIVGRGGIVLSITDIGRLTATKRLIEELQSGRIPAEHMKEERSGSEREAEAHEHEDGSGHDSSSEGAPQESSPEAQEELYRLLAEQEADEQW